MSDVDGGHYWALPPHEQPRQQHLCPGHSPCLGAEDGAEETRGARRTSVRGYWEQNGRGAGGSVSDSADHGMQWLGMAGSRWLSEQHSRRPGLTFVAVALPLSAPFARQGFEGIVRLTSHQYSPHYRKKDGETLSLAAAFVLAVVRPQKKQKELRQSTRRGRRRGWYSGGTKWTWPVWPAVQPGGRIERCSAHCKRRPSAA